MDIDGHGQWPNCMWILPPPPLFFSRYYTYQTAFRLNSRLQTSSSRKKEVYSRLLLTKAETKPLYTPWPNSTQPRLNEFYTSQLLSFMYVNTVGTSMQVEVRDRGPMRVQKSTIMYDKDMYRKPETMVSTSVSTRS